MTLLAGCPGKPSPVNLYSLYPVNNKVKNITGEYTAMTVIMPVRLAPHLEQAGPVSAKQPPRTDTSPLHLWSAPLDRQLTQVITANLSNILHSPYITTYPGPRYAKYRYQIEVEILEFSNRGSFFEMQALWSVSDVPKKNILMRSRFSGTHPVNAGDYVTTTETWSRMVYELCIEIATLLNNATTP